jgi:hypothetical protein
LIDLHPDKSGLDPKLVGTDMPTFNSPLCGELKVTRFAGGRLLNAFPSEAIGPD